MACTQIIHQLKLVDYLLVQADKPWYNYNLNQKFALLSCFNIGILIELDNVSERFWVNSKILICEFLAVQTLETEWKQNSMKSQSQSESQLIRLPVILIFFFVHFS